MRTATLQQRERVQRATVLNLAGMHCVPSSAGGVCLVKAPHAITRPRSEESLENPERLDNNNNNNSLPSSARVHYIEGAMEWMTHRC